MQNLLNEAGDVSATGTVADLLGRPPRDIADFGRDHATAFTPADDR